MVSGPSPTRKIAVLATAFFHLSHADVIVSRWRTPYPGDADWGWQPGGQCKLVSLYVDQRDPGLLDGKADLTESFAKREALLIAESIEEALTLGTGRLAVDGVLLIAEHGSYPLNELGQICYPRKAWFDRVVEVFRQSGRGVPVFCDKHLSYEVPGAMQMVRTAEALGFALFSGSTLPWCDFEPPLALARDEVIRSAIGIFCGGPETYGFHGLEALASVLRQRKGGEAGVAAITAWRGAQVRTVLDRIPPVFHQTVWEPLLAGADVQIALAGDSPRLVLFELEHRDGLRSHLLGLDRSHRKFLVAVDQGGPKAATVRMGGAEDGYGHFARLNHWLEKMFLDGKAPIAPQRSLFTTCTLVHLMEALANPGDRRCVPETSPAYAPHCSS